MINEDFIPDYSWVQKQALDGINFVRQMGRSPQKITIGSDAKLAIGLHFEHLPSLLSGRYMGIPLVIDESLDGWTVKVE